MNGTNFSQWSEDDWLEKRFYINTKFMFDHQRYENVIIRTGINEWSFELSNKNGSYSNKLWTELHLFLTPHTTKTILNNSISDYLVNDCDPPIISPLTNTSNFSVPELLEMDERIANYFISNSFFRTINYLKCSIIEERQNPSIRVRIDVYFVTNRDFQSLIFIEMLNSTQHVLSNYQAKFYLHDSARKFNTNFNISNINHGSTSSSKVIHMIKLYTEKKPKPNNSLTLFSNSLLILFHMIIFLILQ